MNAREKYYRSCPTPKHLPRRIVKARKGRSEDQVKREVRAECVERDGDCRICNLATSPGDWHEDDFPMPDESFLWNPSEWAHLDRSKRARTRGMSPELRHTTAGTAMLCRFHHELYDAGKLLVELMSNLGADGPLNWRQR